MNILKSRHFSKILLGFAVLTAISLACGKTTPTPTINGSADSGTIAAQESPTDTPNPVDVTYVGGFAGVWDTNWGDLTCSVDSLAVHCEYVHDLGRIDATLSEDGKTMEGVWAESPSYAPPDDGGKVTFTLSEDGNAIDGYWWYGEDVDGGVWTGTRK